MVKRDRYYSRYSDQRLGAAIIFGKFQFSKLQMWEKFARSSLSLSRTNIDVIFICSRVPKCKTEIVAVLISDSVSAQFVISGIFFHSKLTGCENAHPENDYYDKTIKKARSSIDRN